MSSPISTILANLRRTVNVLRSAVYAIDVRDDIADAIDDSADAIEQIYSDVDSASLREDAFAAALQEAIDDNLLPIPATVIDDNSLPGTKIQNASIPLSKLAEPVQITVDSALSGTSTNPVQNKVIKETIDELNGSLSDGGELDVTELSWEQGALSSSGGNTNDGSLLYIRTDYFSLPFDFIINNKSGYTFSIFTYNSERTLIERTTTWQTNFSREDTTDKLYRILVKASGDNVNVYKENVDDYIEISLSITGDSVRRNIDIIKGDINGIEENYLGTETDVLGLNWAQGSLTGGGQESDNGSTSRIRTDFFEIPVDFRITVIGGRKFSLFTYDSEKKLITATATWQTDFTVTDTLNKFYRIIVANTNGLGTVDATKADKYLTISSKSIMNIVALMIER